MNNQRGFSAIELLITLLIGFLFVLMSYQLYLLSIQDSARSVNRVKASTLAYSTLHSEQARAFDSDRLPDCTLEPYTETTAIAGGVGQQIVTIDCPLDTTLDAAIRRVTVKITYGSDDYIQEATYAGYAKR